MRLHPLTDNETRVLAALHGRQPAWACPTEIASETGLPPYTARDTLRALTRRRLVARGGTGHWGQFAITEHGTRRASATTAPKQLELAS